MEVSDPLRYLKWVLGAKLRSLQEQPALLMSDV